MDATPRPAAAFSLMTVSTAQVGDRREGWPFSSPKMLKPARINTPQASAGSFKTGPDGVFLVHSQPTGMG